MPSVTLLVIVIWIIICTFGVWSKRGDLGSVGGPIGAPIAWLLLVILGIILIKLLLGGAI